jgi:hypothetical protein
MSPGAGETSWWGAITISRLGTSTDRRLAALHEGRSPRADSEAKHPARGASRGKGRFLLGSSLIRYLEEALAESFAQISVNGARHVFTDIVFPVRNGYVTLFTKQVVNGVARNGLAFEIAGLYLGIVNVRGWQWDAYYSAARPN